MSNIILVFADCVNSKAIGDYSLAGNLAKDLMQELSEQGITNTEVVLTSTSESLHKYILLYGPELDGYVQIDTYRIKVCAIEAFDALANNIIAYIEANRCRVLPNEIVKMVITPECKIISAGAANKIKLNKASTLETISELSEEESGVYKYFNPADIMLNSCGFNNKSLGLPSIATSSGLSEVSPEILHAPLPSSPYALIYMKENCLNCDLDLLEQFKKLSEAPTYVVIGSYTEAKYRKTIRKVLDPTSSEKLVCFFPSVKNSHMSYLMTNSETLTITTGVMSTVEALSHGKLPYYQWLENNINFVKDYLKALQKQLAQTQSNMNEQVVLLANLLFAQKPLSKCETMGLKLLLQCQRVVEALIVNNKSLINQAQGKLAPRLLTFIQKPLKTTPDDQYLRACRFLRRAGETEDPDLEEALKRSIDSGLIFELRILVKKTTHPTQISKSLHWAIQANQLSCARFLLQFGASADSKDSINKTPLYYAIKKGYKDLVELLLGYGAEISAAIGLTELKENRDVFAPEISAPRLS